MPIELQVLVNYGALGIISYLLLRFLLKTLHRALKDLAEQHERIISQAERHGRALEEIVTALRKLNGK